jgi:hypothetical protein
VSLAIHRATGGCEGVDNKVAGREDSAPKSSIVARPTCLRQRKAASGGDRQLGSVRTQLFAMTCQRPSRRSAIQPSKAATNGPLRLFAFPDIPRRILWEEKDDPITYSDVRIAPVGSRDPSVLLCGGLRPACAGHECLGFPDRCFGFEPAHRIQSRQQVGSPIMPRFWKCP